MSLTPNATPKTVFLVEQEPLFHKFVRTVLERAGFIVLSAGTAEQALRIEQDLPGMIDLLLAGASMLRVPDLAEQFGRHRPELAVMLMSCDDAARTLALDRGWYFVGKPFLPSVLLGQISSALGIETSAVGDQK